MTPGLRPCDVLLAAYTPGAARGWYEVGPPALLIGPKGQGYSSFKSNCGSLRCGGKVRRLRSR
jgi:hypothetical protein